MDTLSLYAKPFAALRDRRLPGGLEILLTVRNIDTSLDGLSQYLSSVCGHSPAAMDRWVFDKSLDTLLEHLDVLISRRLSIAIGVSQQTLHDSRFPAYLHGSLRRVGFPAELLTIRVSETDALRDLRLADRVLQRVRDAGCGVGLEGVGSPAQSYRCIRDLPLTRIYIDGELVRGLMTCAQAESDIKSVLQIIRGLNIQSFADFVESATVAKKLRAMGVDYAHGSVYGCPQPLRTALEALDRSSTAIAAPRHAHHSGALFQ